MNLTTLTPKDKMWIVIALIAVTSIFSFVGKPALNLKSYGVNALVENVSEMFSDHPLDGQTDNVAICANDGQEMHEILLCGASDTRDLNVSLEAGQTISWHKFVEGSCADVNVNCAQSAAGCQWNKVDDDADFTVSDAGEYRITLTNGDGSIERYYFNVSENGLNPISVVENVDCTTNGSITINNMPNNYEYSIDDGANWQGTNSFEIENPGFYTVIIRRDDQLDGCVFELEDIEVKNNSIDASVTIEEISCTNSKASITVTVANADTSYIYELHNSGGLVETSNSVTDSSFKFENLNPGSYDVTVSLASLSSCDWTTDVEIEAFTSLVPTAVVTKNIDCDPGIITINLEGGSEPYEYSTDGGTTFTAFENGEEATVSIESVGDHSVLVRDANGCEANTTAQTVSETTLPTFTVNKTDVVCRGTPDGTLTFNIPADLGFTISYSIDGGTTFSPGTTFNNLDEGTYATAIKVEGNGTNCVITGDDIEISAQNILEIDPVVTHPIDCNNSTATVRVDLNEGDVAPVMYSLNGIDFQASDTFTNVAAGTYNVTVTNGDGCKIASELVLDVANPITDVAIDEVAYDCVNGKTDIEINVTGGEAPFTYELTSPITATSATNNFDDLDPGSYNIKVTSNNGCVVEQNIEVNSPNEVDLNVVVGNANSCHSDDGGSGSFKVDVLNFVDTYNYSLDGAFSGNVSQGTAQTATELEFESLVADTYTLTITLSHSGCEIEKTVEIDGPTDPISVSGVNVIQATCGQTGSVSFSSSGGWSGHQFALRLPDATETAKQNNPSFAGLNQEGTHTILVYDGNDCLNDATTFDLVNAGVPDIQFNLGNSNLCYSNTQQGSLSFDIGGSVAEPISYIVDGNNAVNVPNGSTGFSIDNLVPNPYVIKVIDGNGCDLEFNITVPVQFIVSPKVINKPNCGSADGLVELDTQGGTTPITYEVSKDGGAFETITASHAVAEIGSYTYRVSDAAGCSNTSSPVVIDDAAQVEGTATLSSSSCGTENTGIVTLEATSGIPPFEYSFDGGAFGTSKVFNNLGSGNFEYKIKDSKGCEFVSNINVPAVVPISFTLTQIETQCPDEADQPMKWGRFEITNPQNVTGDVTVEYNRGNKEGYWNWATFNVNIETNIAKNGGSFYLRRTLTQQTDYWVRITDSNGCVWETDVKTHSYPELPTTYSGPAQGLTQGCDNGGPVFDVEITNDLEGPFRYILSPRELVDEDGDGVPEPSGDWESFDDPANPHPDYDPSITGNKVIRLAPPRDHLVFGTIYFLTVQDVSTNCIRGKRLGKIDQPEPSMDFEYKRRGDTCRDPRGGNAAQWIVTNHDQSGDVQYKITYPKRNEIIQDWTSVPGNTAEVEINFTGFLSFQSYFIEIKDARGCIVGSQFATYRPRPLKLDLIDKQDASCYINGRISVEGSGGYADQRAYEIHNTIDPDPFRPLQYAFVPGDETLDESHWSEEKDKEVFPTAYDGVANVYEVFLRDVRGCTLSIPNITIDFTTDQKPVIDSIDITDQCTSTSGMFNAEATISGTSSTVEYFWNGIKSAGNTTSLAAGEHTLEVVTPDGCSVSETFTIHEAFTAGIEVTKVVACDPVNEGEAQIEVQGGSGDFTYEMISPVGTPSNTTGLFTDLSHSTAYEFRVTDNISGCVSPNMTLNMDPPQIPLYELVTPVQHISCNGNNDGQIVVVPQSGVNNLNADYTYSLDGTNYQAQNFFSNLTSGSYTIYVKSAINCVQTLGPVTINEPLPLTLSQSAVTNFACDADNGYGTATVTASILDGGSPSGTAPHLFSFNGQGFGASDTFTLPFTDAEQTVTIEVKDAQNCSQTTTVTIPAAARLKVEIDVTQIMDCNNAETIEFDITNGSGDYTVTSFPSNTTVTGTHTIAIGKTGIHHFQVTDNVTGCYEMISHEVVPYDTIEATLTKTKDIACPGGSDGTLELEISGYTGAYDYTLYNDDDVVQQTGSGDTATGNLELTGLGIDVYYVEIDATQVPFCPTTSNTAVILLPDLNLEVNATIVRTLTCEPGLDGQLQALASGGWGGYEYRITNEVNDVVADFQESNVFTGLGEGFYQVTVRDSQGCEAEAPSILYIDAPRAVILDPNVTVEQLTCAGSNDGSIEVAATGGADPGQIMYFITNVDFNTTSVGQASGTFENLATGTYVIRAEDNKGCFAETGSITITAPTMVTIDGSITKEPSCNEEGQITVSASGGSGSFEFRYHTLDNSGVISATSNWETATVYDLAPGSYEFEARDATHECISQNSVIRTLNAVTAPTIQVNEDAALINCNGQEVATLIAEAQGGKGKFRYELRDENDNVLRNLQDSGTFNKLGAGSYKIRAFGEGNCEVVSGLLTISQPEMLVVDVTDIEHITCSGEAEGSAMVNVIGGVAPYGYILSSDPSKVLTSGAFSNLVAGSYTVLVQDAGGCEVPVDFVIDQPDSPLAVNITDVKHESCALNDDGAITIEITGGTAPYKYSLVSPDGPFESIIDPTNLVINGLNGGIGYGVFVSDFNGCSTYVTQRIDEGFTLSGTVEVNYQCVEGMGMNSITVTPDQEDLASGMMYILDSEDISRAVESNVFEQLSPGEHFVTMIHETGCYVKLEPFTIEEFGMVTLEQVSGNINEIAVEANGGSGNYEYYVNGDRISDNSFFITQTGTYTMSVVDSNGCSAEIEVYMEYLGLEIPDYFTPNGDGHKDIWELGNAQGFPNLSVSIFDRYGREVRSFRGQGTWDGTLNTKDLPSGDYWYIIKLNDEPEFREFIGHITVYR